MGKEIVCINPDVNLYRGVPGDLAREEEGGRTMNASRSGAIDAFQRWSVAREKREEIIEWLV